MQLTTSLSHEYECDLPWIEDGRMSRWVVEIASVLGKAWSVLYVT